jgi:predicted nucleic acid-binding protein
VILVGTSVWIEHLRAGNSELVALLQEGLVLAHPRVTGEISLGQLARSNEILGLLSNLPQAIVATDAEVLTLIENQKFYGLGIGYVDAHLLAATLLTPSARLWTRDKRLASVVARQGVAIHQAGGGVKR